MCKKLMSRFCRWTYAWDESSHTSIVLVTLPRLDLICIEYISNCADKLVRVRMLSDQMIRFSGIRNRCRFKVFDVV